MRSHIRRYPAPAHTYYVDATHGADTNTGTAENLPYQTVTKVNALATKPGDRVMWERGETWTNTKLLPTASGRPGRNIVFGAYGVGVAPIIDGDTRDRAIDTQGMNYLTLQDIHWRGGTGTVIKCASHHVTILNCSVEGDVAELANGIECDKTNYPVYSVIIQGNTVYNNKVRAGGGGGIMIGMDAGVGMTDILVEGNTIYSNGTSATLDHGIYICNTVAAVTVRDNTIYSNTGYGVQLNGVVTNCLIERNAIYLNGGGGIKLDAMPAAGNNTVQNNLIYANVKTGIQTGATCYQANVWHNTIINNSTTPTAYGVHVTNGTLAFVLKNNVVIQDDAVIADEFCYPIRVSHADVLTAAGNVFDYNVYNYPNRSAPRMGDIAGTGRTLAQWQGSVGTPDLNSQYVDPTVATEWTNFHLLVGSPAIAAGDATVGVLYDYDSVPRGAAVDCGAYEYV